MTINRLLKYIVAVLLFVVPSGLISAQEYFSRISMEGVDLLGTITFGMFDKYTKMEPGLYSFDYDRKYQPQKDAPIFRAQVDGGSVYYDGKIYCNEYDGSYQIQNVKPKWKIYDADTYQLLSETVLNDNAENLTYSLAYDPTTDKIYGFKNTYTATYLVEIDPENGSMSVIGDALAPKITYLCLACNKKGQLYCIYLRNDQEFAEQTVYLAKIRKSDARIALIGEMSGKSMLEGDKLLVMRYDQSLFFNNSDDKLYWMFGSSSLYLNSEYMAMFEVNTLNAEATLRSYLLDSYHLSGAFLKEPAGKAPAIVSDFQFVPEAEGALKGTLKFKLPDVSYDGTSLTDAVTVLVKEGDKELIRTTAQPGGEFESELLNFTNDLHTVSITLLNAEGKAGPTIQRNFYVGYDIPKACRNIKLVSDGLKTTLTWDPPVEGMHGAVINPKAVTYTVVRYPYEITVKEGLKECTWIEDHPADMTRYVYMVTPVTEGRKGESALSNNLIVGTPLDLPYGGIFREPADLFNYYTILDMNEDRHTWTYDNNTSAAFYNYSEISDADDWLISPPINYKKGGEYTLSFKAYSWDANYLESMEVRWGKGRTVGDLSKLLLSLPEVPAVNEEHPVQEYKIDFKVDEDGVYYYGFHVTTSANSGFLFIFDINVVDKNQTAISANETGDAVRIQADKGMIRIDNSEGREVAVYNTNGGLVMKSVNRVIEASLATGVYLVQANGKVYKVVVF